MLSPYFRVNLFWTDILRLRLFPKSEAVRDHRAACRLCLSPTALLECCMKISACRRKTCRSLLASFPLHSLFLNGEAVNFCPRASELCAYITGEQAAQLQRFCDGVYECEAINTNRATKISRYDRLWVVLMRQLGNHLLLSPIFVANCPTAEISKRPPVPASRRQYLDHIQIERGSRKDMPRPQFSIR